MTIKMDITPSLLLCFMQNAHRAAIGGLHILAEYELFSRQYVVVIIRSVDISKLASVLYAKLYGGWAVPNISYALCLRMNLPAEHHKQQSLPVGAIFAVCSKAVQV